MSVQGTEWLSGGALLSSCVMGGWRVNDRYSSERDDRDRTMPVRDLTNVNVPGTKLVIGFAPSRALHQRRDGLLARPSDPAYCIHRCFLHANSGRRPVGRALRNRTASCPSRAARSGRGCRCRLRRRPSHGRWYRPSELPVHHDRFDRLLVAAALGATPTIPTPGEGILEYPVSCRR